MMEGHRRRSFVNFLPSGTGPEHKSLTHIHYPNTEFG